MAVFDVLRASDIASLLVPPGSAAARAPGVVAQEAKRSLSVISGKGRFPDALGGGASDANNTNCDVRLACRNGLAPATNIRLAFANVVAAAAIDADGPNPITVRAAIEIAEAPGITVPVTFGGSLSATLDPKAGVVISDPVGITLAPGQLFAVRTNVTVTSGQQFPIGYVVQAGSLVGSEAAVSENSLRNTSASVVYNTGFFAGTAVPGYSPIAILGETAYPASSVGLFGDSILNATGDSVSVGLIRGQSAGFGARGLLLPNGGLIPHVQLSRGGQGLNGFSTALAGLDIHRRLFAANYVTDVLCHMGTNDIASGATFAGMQASYKKFWAHFKYRGKRVTQSLIMPRVTGTYTSAAGQTPIAGFEPGGIRDQTNAWIKTQVGQGLLDDVIDTNPYVEDQANPGRWASPGGVAYTADGVHPSNPAHIAAAQAVQAWAVKLAA